jgi:hypothetical protein
MYTVSVAEPNVLRRGCERGADGAGQPGRSQPGWVEAVCDRGGGEYARKGATMLLVGAPPRLRSLPVQQQALHSPA